MSGLRASVYVAPPIPFPIPKGRTGTWSPISSTLVIGANEALLVDTPITSSQNENLANWVEEQLRPKVATAPTKKLSTIYITHGHFDHWAGIEYFKKRFPGLKVLATAGTIQHMKDSLEPKAFSYWEGLFPGQIDKEFALPGQLPKDGKFYLEGHELQAIDVGHSDTYDTTVLWVPSIKLAVCGDVVYGNVHQMLATAKTKDLREEWIRAIEKIEALGPELVVPGHREADEVDGAFHLKNTKQYIRHFGGLVEGGHCKDSKSLFAAMLEEYPTRFNSGALMWGCAAAFPARSKIKQPIEFHCADCGGKRASDDFYTTIDLTHDPPCEEPSLMSQPEVLPESECQACRLKAESKPKRRNSVFKMPWLSIGSKRSTS